MDRLTKSAHFFPLKIGKKMHMLPLAQLFVTEIVSRHGQPVSITLDRDSRFVSRFWKTLHESMGTKLQFSTTYHPQTDGQSERTIQTLEDMLRACVLDFKTQWDEALPLCEFSYNNSFHSSIGMAPLRHCMAGGVGHLCVGKRLVPIVFMDRPLSVRPVIR